VTELMRECAPQPKHRASAPVPPLGRGRKIEVAKRLRLTCRMVPVEGGSSDILWRPHSVRSTNIAMLSPLYGAISRLIDHRSQCIGRQWARLL